MDHSNMMYQIGLQLYGSRQLANGWRDGAHQPTDLYVNVLKSHVRGNISKSSARHNISKSGVIRKISKSDVIFCDHASDVQYESGYVVLTRFSQYAYAVMVRAPKHF